MTAPSGVRIHDWRSRTSGRIFEVPEVHVFATGEDLHEGDAGFLRFSAGHLYVLRSEDDAAPTTPLRPSPMPEPQGARQGGEVTRRLTRRQSRWLAGVRRRAVRFRLPRLSSTQWFLAMLGVLLLVVVLQMLVG